ncbi:alpha/beta hydrolase [Sphingobacterium paludis]|uniref:S-formylglutathione hydrolase FrmB n=1 Tax=Sphingobacterium paludis TaxID=1476465 RepID=A0A4R7CYR8_9SPHI|nr:alpha/beta hydrolase family protein [Sphingobacterium paludis]TDS13087.1 S-formylglutathione hydrolase FrmB [Sphingobacterium paludis]
MNRTLFILIGLWTISLSLQAQEKWILKSEYLSKPDTVLVFKPDTYNDRKQYPLVYLLHGYSENYKQWSETTDLQKLADQYGMVIVTPDGYVSWYVNSSFDKGSRMEDFFFKDLVPKVHQSLSIDYKNIFISGLSMGGYGALRYFMLHNDYFNSAGSTSGGLNVDFDIFEKASLTFFNNTRVTDDLTRLLGNHLENDWHQYSISELLKRHKTKKEFLIDCGTEDILYPATAELKSLADSLNIPVTFMTQSGDHNPQYWSKSIEHHFVFFKQRLK